MSDIKLLVLRSNTWIHLIIGKNISLDSFKNVIYKMFTNHIYLIYLNKDDLALNNLQPNLITLP